MFFWKCLCQWWYYFSYFLWSTFYLLFVVFVLLYHLCSWFIDVQMANEKWQGILVDCLTVWWDLLLSCWDERSHGSCVSCICPVGWDRMISCSRNENAMKWKCWGAEYYAIGMYSNTHTLSGMHAFSSLLQWCQWNINNGYGWSHSRFASWSTVRSDSKLIYFSFRQTARSIQGFLSLLLLSMLFLVIDVFVSSYTVHLMTPMSSGPLT